MKATILTYHPSRSSAKAIDRSLKADNKDAPKPLRVISKASGTRLKTTISGAEDIESLLTTINDLLLCLVAADKLFAGVDRKVRPLGSL